MNTFIFDMDGLMLDTERVYVDAFDYAGEQMGIGKAGHLVVQTLGLTEEVWKECLRAEFGADYDEAGLLQMADSFVAEYHAKNRVPVKKGLYGLLAFLKDKGCPLGVASSSPYAIVMHHLEQADIRDYFSAVVGGDMVAQSKPNPEIYRQACKLLGQKPEQCWALEDSPAGLQSAHGAGCRVILVPDLWQPTAEYVGLYDRKFDDLDAVRRFLAEEVLT